MVFFLYCRHWSYLGEATKPVGDSTISNVLKVTSFVCLSVCI